MISQISNYISDLLIYVINSLYHNGIYLLVSILIAVSLTVYLDAEKLRKKSLGKPKFLIFGSVGFGALTPLCACGTMAVVLSLLTTAVPWGPIMAFLVSSPLMSPDTFVLMTGFVGLKFAIALAVTSIVLGILAGYVTHYIEKKSGFLNGQLRLVKQPAPKTICNNDIEKRIVCSDNCSGNNKTKRNSIEYENCCVSDNAITVNIPHRDIYSTFQDILTKLKLKQFGKGFFDIGIKKILPLYIAFVIVAYLIRIYIPDEWIASLFNGRHFYSVPLAAIIGLPFYIADATVAPLLQLLKDSGASYGAILAFMITGPGTSLGVLGGLSIIMKRKAIMLYTAYILVGAIIFGYLYDLLLI